jgi:hypothetical protein
MTTYRNLPIDLPMPQWLLISGAAREAGAHHLRFVEGEEILYHGAIVRGEDHRLGIDLVDAYGRRVLTEDAVEFVLPPTVGVEMKIEDNWVPVEVPNNVETPF